jgi:hypothetical protein
LQILQSLYVSLVRFEFIRFGTIFEKYQKPRRYYCIPGRFLKMAQTAAVSYYSNSHLPQFERRQIAP